MDTFEAAYKALNTQQRRAVDTIEGPVMVIAGPGTGKTQVLALRIAHILKETDTPPDGILCLTFTNAGVKAMRERLIKLIGPTATRIKITTFHAYGLELIEEYFEVLGFLRAPTLLDDSATIALFDTVLQNHPWQYLRPRSDPSLYYYDLKSLISTLKRDGVTPDDFAAAVARDIERIQHDPESISSRGETKGQLKKDAEKKIESLTRSLEAAAFYAEYESLKREHNHIDYNDILTSMVRVATESDEAAASIRERFLYVLIDEHQDSSRVQNAFLQALWGDEERPNLFVVGDDRQLIYGFGGASLAYFESFKHTFGTVTLITLTENYRSTQTILDSAEALLTSSLAEGKLTGATHESHSLRLVTAGYPRDEIVAAGLDIKEKIAQGMSPDDCVLLVPKNRQIKTAVTILGDLGIPVAAGSALNLFELPDTQLLLSVFRIIQNPHDAVMISHTMLDSRSGIAPLVAHRYLYETNARTLSVATLIESQEPSIHAWGERLSAWITLAQSADAYQLIQNIGEELLLKLATDDQTLRRQVEIIRTLLHLAMAYVEKGARTLGDFMIYIERLIQYGEDIPLAVFDAEQGVRVLTLHGSKGLEFDSVWIAHMDERSLMTQKRGGFVLPEEIDQQEKEAAEAVAKRQVYVAITRAKRFCTISYAQHNHTGADQKLAAIIEALPPELLIRHFPAAGEAHDDAHALREQVVHTETIGPQPDKLHTLVTTVAQEYADKKISVTMLNNFFECPWKWYFRSLLQLPEPMTESLQVGNIVHKTIEYILDKKTTDRSPDAISKIITKYADSEARYVTALATRLALHAQKIIETWVAQYVPLIVAPYDKEQNLNYRDPEFAHLTITGKIDLVEEIITGEVRVTDWKTGAPKSVTEIEKDDASGRMSGLLRQLAMYSYLIEGHSHHNTMASESRLIFLEAKSGDKHAIVSRHITHDDIKRLRDDITTYDELIKTGNWVHQQCLAKQYREGDVCAYCELARRIYNC